MKHYRMLSNLFQLIGYLSLFFLIYWSVVEDITWLFYSLLYYKIVVGFFGNQIAQHRYFSHQSFKVSSFLHKSLAIISCSTAISPIVYASIHRHHHKHSDSIKDPHSPKFGLSHSILTWTWNIDRNIKPAFDLMRDNFLGKLHATMYYILMITTVVLFIVSWKFAIFVFLAGIGWNYIHMGLFRTSLFHVKLPGSYRNYNTDDNSWNNVYLQILDIGEGLHNNHHKFPNNYNQATMPKEYDFAGWVIKRFLI
jgi:stearoyl-CoA desaturase (delta-9 desaturase)